MLSWCGISSSREVQHGQKFTQFKAQRVDFLCRRFPVQAAMDRRRLLMHRVEHHDKGRELPLLGNERDVL